MSRVQSKELPIFCEALQGDTFFVTTIMIHGHSRCYGSKRMDTCSEETAKKQFRTLMKRQMIKEEAMRRAEERRSAILDQQEETEYRLMEHEAKKERYLDFKRELDGLRSKNKEINVERQRRREEHERESIADSVKKKDEKIDQLNAERQRMWELRRAAQAEAYKAREAVKTEILRQRIASAFDSKKLESKLENLMKSDMFSAKIITSSSCAPQGMGSLQGRGERPVAPPPPAMAPQGEPPPPENDTDLPEKLPQIEVVGDELWFSHVPTRRSLRERVIAAHAAQKILVASPATEIKRICPGPGRILGAGAVLRLGGSLLGGYGEDSEHQHALIMRQVTWAPGLALGLSGAAVAAREPRKFEEVIAESGLEDWSVKDYEAMRDDVPRTSKFEAAIQRRLKQQPQATVLDIGTGPFALLAVIAAKAGAKKVYAIEKTLELGQLVKAS
eukprot:s1800_g12.t2